MKYINMEYHPMDSRIKIDEDDICQTLNTRMGTGGGVTSHSSLKSVRTLTEKRFFEWHEDDIAVTLRYKGGSYGCGSEVLVIEE